MAEFFQQPSVSNVKDSVPKGNESWNRDLHECRKIHFSVLATCLFISLHLNVARAQVFCVA